MQIRENAFGTVVCDRFTSDRGSEKFVEVTVKESTIGRMEINVAATGDLNREGIAALKRVLAVAEAIVESGGLEIV